MRVVIFRCSMLRNHVHFYDYARGNVDAVHSMEMDFFLHGFRCFVIRKGPPSNCYTDNGTNFTEVNKEIAERGRRIISEVPRKLIRSSETARLAVFNGRWTLTDVILQTVLVEAEGLLNSRPLTHSSVDNRDQEPLIPRVKRPRRYDMSIDHVCTIYLSFD